MTSRTRQKHSWQFDAIGTRWAIETFNPIDDLKELIVTRIDEFEKVYSRFRDDSLVAKISTKPGVYNFPIDALDLVGFYRKLYDVTGGALTPLIGDALIAAGYDKRYSLQPGTVTAVPSWDEVMIWRENEVTTTRPLTLDFGAAGKGYLVDIIAEIVEKNGIEEYVIDASGDMCVRGVSEVVGLENPYDSSSVIGVMHVSDASLCASAINRRSWGEWHHIIDSRTAEPARDIVATWVSARTAMIADGVATALFFVSPGMLRQWEFEYVRLFADGHVERSDNFVGELYI